MSILNLYRLSLTLPTSQKPKSSKMMFGQVGSDTNSPYTVTELKSAEEDAKSQFRASGFQSF